MEFNATLLDAMYGVGDHADTCIEHVWRPWVKPCLTQKFLHPLVTRNSSALWGVMAEGFDWGHVESSMQSYAVYLELARKGPVIFS